MYGDLKGEVGHDFGWVTGLDGLVWRVVYYIFVSDDKSWIAKITILIASTTIQILNELYILKFYISLKNGWNCLKSL